MFWTRKKKPSPAVAAPEDPAHNGFFSTTPNLPSRFDLTRQLQNAIAKSIQVDPNKFVARDAAGTAMDASGFQSAKFVNQGMGYLPIHQIDWYGSQGFIGWQICAIIAQNWLVDKALTMPAKDAVRHGWEVTLDSGDIEVGPETMDRIRKMDKKYGIKRNCIEFIKMGRTFGIRHALFLVEGINYELPFNPDGVRPGTYKGITQIDPYWLAPELDSAAAANPAAKDFYEPTWWRVNGKRVHKSHFIIMRNGDQVADILKPSYFYGGIPTPQKIYERVYAAERTANEAPLLAMSKRMTVLNLDITQAIADPDKFAAKMQEWSALMNNFGVKVVGGEEVITQFDTSLQGLDETVMTQYQLVAAASGVPATKLLGTQPKGFNASGNYEEASYHEELESIQENDLSALIERHLVCTMRSDLGMAGVNAEVKWLPVDSPTALEAADINSKKADADSKWQAAGAIDGFDIRQRLIKDRDSGYTGIEDMVPGGVGDRDHEAEMAAAAMELEPADENPNKA